MDLHTIEELNRQLPKPSPVQIAKAAAADIGTPWEVVVGPDRRKAAVAARRFVALTLRQRTTLSTSGIGRVLGGRDHTTVCNLLNLTAVAKRRQAARAAREAEKAARA